MMSRFFQCMLVIAVIAIPGAAHAQSAGNGQGSAPAATPLEFDILKIDVVYVAAGYRATKIIGGDVYNDANDKIGKVDDLIVQPNDKVIFGIVSVGGFLGIGDRPIAVPYEAFKFSNDGKVVLAGATKERLKNAPEFTYK